MKNYNLYVKVQRVFNIFGVALNKIARESKNIFWQALTDIW